LILLVPDDDYQLFTGILVTTKVVYVGVQRREKKRVKGDLLGGHDVIVVLLARTSLGFRE
jgi:hypothetical protein